MPSVVIKVSLPSEKEWNDLERSDRGHIVRRIQKQIVAQIGEGPWPKAPNANQEGERNLVGDKLRQSWREREQVVLKLACFQKTYPPCIKPLLNAVQSAGWAVSDAPKWLYAKDLTNKGGENKIEMEIML